MSLTNVRKKLADLLETLEISFETEPFVTNPRTVKHTAVVYTNTEFKFL